MQAMLVGGTDTLIGNRGAKSTDETQKFVTGPLLGLPSQSREIGQHTGWGRVSMKGMKLNGDDFDPNWGLQVHVCVWLSRYGGNMQVPVVVSEWMVFNWLPP